MFRKTVEKPISTNNNNIYYSQTFLLNFLKELLEVKTQSNQPLFMQNPLNNIFLKIDVKNWLYAVTARIHKYQSLSKLYGLPVLYDSRIVFDFITFCTVSI